MGNKFTRAVSIIGTVAVMSTLISAPAFAEDTEAPLTEQQLVENTEEVTTDEVAPPEVTEDEHVHDDDEHHDDHDHSHEAEEATDTDVTPATPEKAAPVAEEVTTVVEEQEAEFLKIANEAPVNENGEHDEHDHSHAADDNSYYLDFGDGKGAVQVATDELDLETLESGDKVTVDVGIPEDVAEEADTNEEALEETLEEVAGAHVEDENAAVTVKNLEVQSSAAQSMAAAVKAGKKIDIVYIGRYVSSMNKTNARNTLENTFAYWNIQSYGQVPKHKVNSINTIATSEVVCRIPDANRVAQKKGINTSTASQARYLVFMVDKRNCGDNWGGWGTVNGPNRGGTTLNFMDSSKKQQPSNVYSIIAHEIGHNQGLVHGHTRVCRNNGFDTNTGMLLNNRAVNNCFDSVYTDRYNVMSGSMFNSPPAALNADQKFANGFLPKSKVYSAPTKNNGNKRVTLVANGVKNSVNGYRAISIPAGKDNVFVEYRSATGADAQYTLKNGAVHSTPSGLINQSKTYTTSRGVKVSKLYNKDTTALLHSNGGWKSWVAPGKSMKPSGSTPTIKVISQNRDRAVIELQYPKVKTPHPAGASIKKGDFVTRDATGNLWNYSKFGKAKRFQIGSGWRSFRNITVTDFNADGVMDMIGNKGDKLYLYTGKKNGGFNKAQVIGKSGWKSLNVQAVKAKKTDKYPTLMVQFPKGDVRSYKTTNGKSLKAGVKIGSGFKHAELRWAYIDKDNNIDAVGKASNGKQTLYRTNGSRFISEKRKVIGSGWKNYHTSVQSNQRGNGSNGFAAKAGGKLYYYEFTGNGSIGKRSTIGNSGWANYYLISQSL